MRRSVVAGLFILHLPAYAGGTWREEGARGELDMSIDLAI